MGGGDAELAEICNIEHSEWAGNFSLKILDLIYHQLRLQCMLAEGFINCAPNQKAVSVGGGIAIELPSILAFLRLHVRSWVNTQAQLADVGQRGKADGKFKSDGFRLGSSEYLCHGE